MAELSKKEQLALNEFNLRYRAALAKQHQTLEESLETVRQAVREQYESEQAQRRHKLQSEAPAAEDESEESET